MTKRTNNSQPYDFFLKGETKPKPNKQMNLNEY